MNKQYVLTNIPYTGLSPIIQNDRFCLYGDHNEEIIINEKKNICIIDGYIIPKTQQYNNFQDLRDIEIIQLLYNKVGNDFINYIKGQFIIIIANNSEFTIFTGRSGVKKFFIYKKSNNYFITNKLHLFKNFVEFSIDSIGLFNYILFNNNICGKTLFQNIHYSEPSTVIKFTDELIITKWFETSQLLDFNYQNQNIKDIAQSFKEILRNSLNHFNVKNAAVTLTGGMDSRLLLSLLLSEGLSPNTFVYGNQNSKDVKNAKSIAESLNIKLNNYCFNEEENLFNALYSEIIYEGGGLINLHRAHRLHAYKSFANDSGMSQVLLTGHMGGELIKNFFYDGIIISPFAQNLIINGSLSLKREDLINVLRDKLLNEDLIYKHVDEYYSYLNEVVYFNSNQKQNELEATFNLHINLYHSQDILLAEPYFDYIYPFFLDDDVIDITFKTRNSFYYTRKSKFNILNKIESHRFYCEMISILSPELSHMPFNKKGSFSAHEFTNDNRLQFLIKRAYRYYNERNTSFPNFAYQDWFKKIIVERGRGLASNTNVSKVFDFNRLNSLLSINNHKTDEGYWRRFSNIVFLSDLLNEYCE